MGENKLVDQINFISGLLNFKTWVWPFQILFSCIYFIEFEFKIFPWINQRIYSLHSWPKFWLIKLKNLFQTAQDVLFKYDLVKSKKYFWWLNQLLFESAKHWVQPYLLICTTNSWLQHPRVDWCNQELVVSTNKMDCAQCLADSNKISLSQQKYLFDLTISYLNKTSWAVWNKFLSWINQNFGQPCNEQILWFWLN